jgi:hypothetical protein
LEVVSVGVLYHPQPLNDEQFADAEWARWLKRAGIEPLPSGDQGRWPTLVDLRQALDSIEGCEARCLVWKDGLGETFFDVDVTTDQPGSRSPISVLNFDGDENKPVQFYFVRGWVGLNLLALKHLVRICGPYIIYGDDAAAPVMIDADTDLAAVLAWWESERVRLFDELVSTGVGERLNSQ